MRPVTYPTPSVFIAEVPLRKWGLLRVGDIAIGVMNAEVVNLIAQRLKSGSPYARMMMATPTNGVARSGYIPMMPHTGRTGPVVEVKARCPEGNGFSIGWRGHRAVEAQ